MRQPSASHQRTDKVDNPPASKGRVTDPFLGNVIEIAIVTRDHRHTMEGLWRLGIGPWQVHTFSSENTTDQTYRGKPSLFRTKVCFARVRNMIWELIEPVSGATIFAESRIWLNK
jgi:methylmalonyl-CoA/ethylmalonyl-CoA epimerase